MNEPFKPTTTMSPQQPLQQQQQSQQQENNAGPNQQAIQPRLKPILKPSAPVTPQNNPVPTTTPMTQSTVPVSAPSSVKSDDVDKDEEMPVETKELPRWKRPKVPGSKLSMNFILKLNILLTCYELNYDDNSLRKFEDFSLPLVILQYLFVLLSLSVYC